MPSRPVPYPHGDPNVLAEPGLDVLIVGAGLQGMLAARRLTEEGLRIAVLERQRSVGGIWASQANFTSRAQNHEAAYRMGYEPAEEDYTRRDGIIEHLRRGVAAAGAADRVLCGFEVVRATEESSCVRVFYRRVQEAEGGEAGRLLELCVPEVLFCTGTLQRPRDVVYGGEDVFGGPIVHGLQSKAEELNLRGKRVVVLGFGAFAIENAREALLAGAAHVTMLVRHKTFVLTRFARVLSILQFHDYSSNRTRAQRRHQPPYPVDPTLLVFPPYVACDARTAMPEVWLHAIREGRTPDVWRSDTPSNTSTSDIFFIGYALGRLQVVNGHVDHYEPGTVVVKNRDGSVSSLAADAVIKNLGFEEPDKGDLLGGICEVTGHTVGRPPIWVTPRISTFRHCTEVASMLPQEWLHVDELYNFVGSGSFASSCYLEIYLHYRQHPEKLRRLLDGDELPRKPFSKITKLDMSRGYEVALSFDEAVRRKVDARRHAINVETWKSYSPTGTPPEELSKAWVQGFLRVNKEDWRDACRKLTGDADAVPYVWDSFLPGLHEHREGAPLQAAL